jgi:hypothetical protein
LKALSSPLPAVPIGREWRFCLQLTSHESSLSTGAEVFDGLRVSFWSDCWIEHEVGWLCLFSKDRISSPQDTMAVSRPSVSGFARLTHWESPWVTSNPEIVGRRPEGLRYGLEKIEIATPSGKLAEESVSLWPRATLVERVCCHATPHSPYRHGCLLCFG